MYKEYPKDRDVPDVHYPEMSRKSVSEAPENIDDLRNMLHMIREEQRKLPSLEWIEQSIAMIDALCERASTDIEMLPTQRND